jgi:hypothetical protein
VLAAEFDQILLVILLAAKETQIDDYFFKILSRVLRRDRLATCWTGILFRQVLKKDIVMVLENVEIQNGFRDWHFRKYA